MRPHHERAVRKLADHFANEDGFLAVIVGGSVAEWDRALALAQPVMETIVITGS